MAVVRLLCAFAAVLLVNVNSVCAQTPSSLDAMVNNYLGAIAEAGDAALGTGCQMKLNDSGTGSQCSCDADGADATCSCSGNGNSRVCTCTDGTTKTYCYFCNNGGGCKCGPTLPKGIPNVACS
jgi:hypothetical protein